MSLNKSRWYLNNLKALNIRKYWVQKCIKISKETIHLELAQVLTWAFDGSNAWREKESQRVWINLDDIWII